MADGKVTIDIELEDSDVKSQADKAGDKAGKEFGESMEKAAKSSVKGVSQAVDEETGKAKASASADGKAAGSGFGDQFTSSARGSIGGISSAVGSETGKAKSVAKSDGKAAGKAFGDGFSSGAESALSGLGGKIAAAVGALGIGSVLSSAVDVANEFNEDMGKLEVAFTQQGWTVEQASGAYRDFVGILGETDQSVEAVNHLALLTNSQEELSEWTNIAAGVYATFGDSLPLEGLTEAANETAKVGQVTGPLADAINWSNLALKDSAALFGDNTKAQSAWEKALKDGMSAEDAFNAALAEMGSEQERSSAITAALSATYRDAGLAYQDTNDKLIAYRQSQSDLNAAMAEFGEAAMPFMTALAKIGTEILENAGPAIENLQSWVKELGDYLGPIVGPYIEDFVQALKDLNEACQPIIEALQPVVEFLGGVFLNVFLTIITVVTEVINGITDFIYTVQGLPDQVSQAIEDVKNWFAQLPSAIGGFLDQIISDIGAWANDMKNQAVQAGQNFLNGVQEKFNEVVSFFTSIPGRIQSALGNLGNLLFSAGQSVIQGFLNGLQSMWNNVTGFFSSLTSMIPNVKGPKQRDLKLLTPSGKWIMESLEAGFNEGYSGVQQTLENITDSIAVDLKATKYGTQLGSSVADSITADMSATKLAYQSAGASYNTNNQTINFNQPIKSPYEVARQMRMQRTYGLAGSR